MDSLHAVYCVDSTEIQCMLPASHMLPAQFKHSPAAQARLPAGLGLIMMITGSSEKPAAYCRLNWPVSPLQMPLTC